MQNFKCNSRNTEKILKMGGFLSYLNNQYVAITSLSYQLEYSATVTGST